MKRIDLDQALVIQQYYELRSCKKVADLYGCCGETISRILKANGINRIGWKVPEKKEPKYRFKPTEESVAMLLDVYKSTKNVAAVCEAVHCHPNTAYKILQKQGIHLSDLKSNTAWINSKQADEAAAYYVQGHSVRETAEKFNVSAGQINNLAKKRKISNGKDWNEAGSQAANNKRRAEAIQSLLKHLNEIGFEYVGGYTGGNGKATVKCCKCGYEFERTVDFLRDGNVVCRECQKRETIARQEEKKRIAKQNADVKQVERLWYKLTHPTHDELQHEAFLNRSGICEICGKPYTVREYVGSCGMKFARDNGVCSAECRRIKKNKQYRESHKRRGVRDSHRARARINGCEYDPSVTLKKLIARDGLRCAICGGMCDLNDHSWSEYSGPMYPSIDHIIPMSKGGGHTWDNVQIAHIICNSYKSDKVVGE